MSATMLTSSVMFAPAKASAQHRRVSRQMQPARASYRSGPNFNAADAFQQAAKQFAQFQKQQQASSQQRSQGRGNASKAEAFRGSYGPFQWDFDAEQFDKFMSEVDRAFGGRGSPMPSADTAKEAASGLYFPADLAESSSEYKYTLDLPGVPKSDIKVEVDKDRKLVISGARKMGETAGWRQWKQERRFGPFLRKFQLPEDADIEKISGKAEQGVLTITVRRIPKEDIPSDTTSIPIY